MKLIRLPCHHTIFISSRKYNSWLGEFISILTLTLNFKEYQKAHNTDHHSGKQLLTPGDETYEYLINTVGFRLGMTTDEAWKHLRETLLSPKFYINRCLSRLNDTFLSDSHTHNILSYIFWLPIISFIILINSCLTFFIAWIIPISIFFEASSLLRQCVEHKFPVPMTSNRTPQILNQMTTAIFCGEQTPQIYSSDSITKRFFLWSKWWLRMFFYHLPCRVLILTGDSAGGHDWHHRNQGSSEWLNCIFERQKEIESGVQYYHTWGLLEAINETFKTLS